MSRAVGYAAGVAVFAAVVLGDRGPATAALQPSRVVDRTFRCALVPLDGDVGAFSLDTVPVGATEPYDPRQERSPGFLGISSGGRSPETELVSVRARAWRRFAATQSDEGVYASSKRCAAARVAVPLSAKGLPGPAIRWAMHETCLTPGRILVRVRARLASPATWQPQPGSGAYSGVRRAVVTAELAVRSEQTGKPIAYLRLERGGTTKLWYEPGCVS